MPGLTGVSVGVITPLKRCDFALFARFCTCTQLNDSVQYVESPWEVRFAGKKENTSVAVLNSLNSQILNNTTKETRRQGTGGARSNNRAGRKRKASILAHRSDLYSFHLSLSQRCLQSWSRPTSQSRVDFGVCFPYKYLLTTHHVVLERSSIKLYMNPPINMFLIAGLLLISKSSLGYSTRSWMRSCCGFQRSSFSHVFVDFLFTLCCVMLATSSSLSLTPLKYLAGELWELFLVLALFSCLSSEVIFQFFFE